MSAWRGTLQLNKQPGLKHAAGLQIHQAPPQIRAVIPAMKMVLEPVKEAFIDVARLQKRVDQN